MPVTQAMTAEEFINLPVPEHGRPWNLVEGEVVVNEATPLHMTVLSDLASALRQWTHAQPGRMDTAADEVLVFRRSTTKAPSFAVALQLGIGDALESPLLPGFALALGDLFAE